MSGEVVEQVVGPAAKVLNIYQRKAKAMLALSSIPKNGYNSYAKYHYATDADVLDTMRVLLATHGIGWDVSTKSHSWNADKNRTIVELEISLVNIDDPSDCVTVTWYGEANDKTDKGTVKAQTSGVKYFLLKSFLASAGNESDDADSGSKPGVQTDDLATMKQKSDIRTLMHNLGINGEKAVDEALIAAGFPKLSLVKKGRVDEISIRLKKATQDKKVERKENDSE